jgi:hypothetical protein
MDEYRNQVARGVISKAYKGLMEYIMDLRTYLKNKHPEYYIPSSIYFGYMDMTYFSFFPTSFKNRKLKVAIVFCHETCRFEVWLAGSNKQIQTTYWKMFKESDWDKYPVPSTIKGVDYIIEYILVENPDFSDLDKLTKQIEMPTSMHITPRILTAFGSSPYNSVLPSINTLCTGDSR